jgi:hypothetical protein
MNRKFLGFRPRTPLIGKDISDIEMVMYLMKKNNLYQKDLAPIFGGQANVSKFLNGERELGKKHISYVFCNLEYSTFFGECTDDFYIE